MCSLFVLRRSLQDCKQAFLELRWPKLKDKELKKEVGEQSSILLRLVRQWPLTKDNPQLCTVL